MYNQIITISVTACQGQTEVLDRRFLHWPLGRNC